MISDQIELSVEPPTHGREAAGVSHTSTGQASPTTAIAIPPSVSWRAASKRPRPRGAIHSQASAIPGTTSSAAPIFVSKPSPTATPESTIHFVRPSCRPRTRSQIAATEQSTSSASGLLWREIATVTGVSTSARPPTKPAVRPKKRRTRSYVSPALAIPISACGTRIGSELKPKIRTDSACTHSAIGGLSTVISPLESNEP